MKIKDLINSADFSFNVPFRVLEYLGNYDDDGTPNDDTKLVYESWQKDVNPDLANRLGEEEITAINTGDDGVTEIEFTQFFTYYGCYDYPDMRKQETKPISEPRVLYPTMNEIAYDLMKISVTISEELPEYGYEFIWDVAQKIYNEWKMGGAQDDEERIYIQEYARRRINEIMETEWQDKP